MCLNLPTMISVCIYFLDSSSSCSVVAEINFLPPFLESFTYSLKKPKHSKSCGMLKVTIDPMPDRNVLGDIIKQSAASKVVTQTKEGLEPTAEFYKRFGDVLKYLKIVVVIADNLAGVCRFPSDLLGYYKFTFTV